MKRSLFVLTLVAFILVSCRKEDNIHIIPIDTNVEENLGPISYCVIGHDTIQFGNAISFNKYEQTYYFYDTNSLLALEIISPAYPEIPCQLYYGGHTLLFHYTINTRQIENMREIFADGTCTTDTSIHMQLRFRDTITNLNCTNGKGWLAKDFDTLAITQLSFRHSQTGGYYELCNAQDYSSYSLGRIRILGNIHSGSYELEDNDEVQVFYEKGIPGTCPGVSSYLVNKGTLQFSNNGGKYSVILLGETQHWKINLEYNGQCFNATQIPLTW